ncbi:hypothetical protein sscle_02g013710 [Sclerotinia sclerotiorum 1980 UF-70]|uniref:Uncharacterized protein n=1 Tax=Sclerotinia sclerotiorum (strain ATCC 18683 / 1980 / Ss-1) TaxID=665079 RepID=A0A1D9PV69_SCLS1|nr:hypothetical protein sscle_02g013710 [Sclerotinia sclerotiorum 1980 UF-70]
MCNKQHREVYNSILASPIKQDADSAARVPVPMTAADRFLVSSLDYMDWANKMVAEGKAYWPDKSVTTKSRQSLQAAP